MMATPLGHGLAGAVIAGLATPADRRAELPTHRLAICAACLAIAPDLDFLPGLFLGEPARFHQGISHSLGAAVVAAVVAAWLIRPDAGLWTYRSRLVIFWSAWTSHLVIDLFGVDRSAPTGIPILWPLSDARFLSPWPLLPGVRHGEGGESDLSSWLGSLVGWENAAAILIEGVVFGAVGLWVLRGRRRRWKGV